MPTGKGTYGTKVGRPTKKIGVRRPTTKKPPTPKNKMMRGMMK
jgi:hypothetical protein